MRSLFCLEVFVAPVWDHGEKVTLPRTWETTAFTPCSGLPGVPPLVRNDGYCLHAMITLFWCFHIGSLLLFHTGTSFRESSTFKVYPQPSAQQHIFFCFCLATLIALKPVLCTLLRSPSFSRATKQIVRHTRRSHVRLSLS